MGQRMEKEGEIAGAVQTIVGAMNPRPCAKDFGRVMAAFQKAHRGRADNTQVRRIIMQVLA